MTQRKARPIAKGSVPRAKASFAAALDAAYPAKAASRSRPAASDELRLMSAMAKACIQKSLTPAPVGFKVLPTPFQVVHDSILKTQYRTKFAKDNLNDILLRSPFSLAFDTFTRNNIKLLDVHMGFVFPTAPKHLRDMLPSVAWPPLTTSESAKEQRHKPAAAEAAEAQVQQLGSKFELLQVSCVTSMSPPGCNYLKSLIIGY